MKFYGKMKRLKRGITIAIFVTFKCNLNCWYCGVHEIRDKKSGELLYHYPNKPIGEILRFLLTFPVKIKEVYITGGEPTIRKDLSGLINALLDRNYFVTLFTNLHDIEIIKQIKKTYRFRIEASYHWQAGENEQKFISKYNQIKDKYRIDVHEVVKKIEDKKLSFSTAKIYDTKEQLQKGIMFRIAPDFTIYTSCYDVMINRGRFVQIYND